MREYFAVLERAGLPMNAVQTVGHTQVRALTVGLEDRQATPEQMGHMKALVREAMEAGAIGLSTSLIYPPAVFASEAEITELAKVAGEYGGRYYTHMRNEGDRLLEAIDEALRIGRAAGTPVHIFHLKTAGRANWGKMDLAIARIQAARAAGEEVAADIYPYVNNGLGIRALIHPRHSAQGPEELLRRLDDAATRTVIRGEMETGTGWENWYAHVGHDWDLVVVAGMETAEFAPHNGKSIGGDRPGHAAGRLGGVLRDCQGGGVRHATKHVGGQQDQGHEAGVHLVRHGRGPGAGGRGAAGESPAGVRSVSARAGTVRARPGGVVARGRSAAHERGSGQRDHGV